MANPATILKRPALVVLILTLALAAGAFLRALDEGNSIPEELVIATLGTIIEEVSITGKVTAAESVALAFEESGTLSAIAKKVGDPVKRGETIAWFDSAELLTELNLRKAAVKTQEARIAKLKAPTPAEELAVQNAKVAAAASGQEGAREKLWDSIRGAYLSADDAVRNKTDQLFSNPISAGPTFILTAGTINPQVKSDAERERTAIESMLNSWSILMVGSKEKAAAYDFAEKSLENLLKVESFLDKVTVLLNGSSAGGSLAQNQLDGYRSAVSQARTSVSSIHTGLIGAREALRAAEASLVLAQQEYRLAERGASAEELEIENAVLREREAAVQSIQVKLAKHSLRSPISGVITGVEKEVGETVSLGVSIITIQKNESLAIEANVPEVDIGKIATDNPVSVIFDAFPGEQFNGRVIKIDPAETIVDGVVNFKITVRLENPDKRIKSGLTANLSVETAKKEGLVLPEYAILENDFGTFVREFDGGDLREIPVKIGIRSEDGLAEVLSGLRDGAKVLNIGVKRNSK